MRITRSFLVLVSLAVASFLGAALAQNPDTDSPQKASFNQTVEQNAQGMIDEGRQTFRFATFGDEAFWGDQLHLHEAIEGQKLGGVGPGVSPASALAVGLKVDVDALRGKWAARFLSSVLVTPVDIVRDALAEGTFRIMNTGLGNRAEDRLAA